MKNRKVIFLLLFIYPFFLLGALDENNRVSVSQGPSSTTELKSVYFSLTAPKDTGYWEGVDERGNSSKYVIGLESHDSTKGDISNRSDSIPFYTKANEFAGYYRLVEEDRIYFEAVVETVSGKTVIIFEPLGEPDYPEFISNWLFILKSFSWNRDPQAIIDEFNKK
ncbi:MAG: hypothetical protein JXR86_10085 [Spirochaetales bacterium]|nr:hypothetical protein [Spirochaetales bacterium]